MNNDPGGDCIFLGSRSIATLAAGSTNRSGNYTVTIPSNTAAGTYYLGAYADYQNQVPEYNENNNGLAGNQITITTCSDPDNDGDCDTE